MSTPTIDEYWQWNGQSLQMPYWGITSFGGSRQELPLLRGQLQNYAVAYRAGQMWRPKQYDQRVILSPWPCGLWELI